MTSETTTTTVGPYRVDGLIGRGGMGEVHRAYDTRRQRTVALKLLPAALSGDAEYRERFRRESLVAAALTSPHVVPIHDFGDIDGRLFIDMRLIDGADLAHQIAGRPMAPQRAVAIVTQVCDALADAHAHGIVHRDVKPSNILLTATDFAYLVDFGIAASDNTGPGLTATGNTIGTFGYMAPERFDGRAADARSDVYALGCVLHELLTGARPFAEHTSTPSLIRAHLMVDPAPPSAGGAPVPAALDRAILQAMAKDPADRQGSAAALADALRGSVAIPDQRGRGKNALTSFAAPNTRAGQQTIPPASGRSQVQSNVHEKLDNGRTWMTKKLVATGAVALLLLVVGAVGGSLLSGSPTTSTPPSATSPSYPYNPGVSASSPDTTGAAAVSFGESQEIRTGVTAVAAEPQPWQPPSTASGTEGGTRFPRAEITITNNTDRFINFSEQFYPELKIDGAQTNSVLDFVSGANVGALPNKAVAPGASATFSVAWALPDQHATLSLELTPSSTGGGGRTVSWSGDA